MGRTALARALQPSPAHLSPPRAGLQNDHSAPASPSAQAHTSKCLGVGEATVLQDPGALPCSQRTDVIWAWRDREGMAASLGRGPPLREEGASMRGSKSGDKS